MKRNQFSSFLFNLKYISKYFFFLSGGSETIYKKSSLCFFLYSSNVHITLHGFPAATTLSGISEHTKLHAPIIVLFPILTLGNIVVLQPIKQLFPMVIVPYITVSLFPSGKLRITLVAASWVINAHSNEIVVLSPTVIKYGSLE